MSAPLSITLAQFPPRDACWTLTLPNGHVVVAVGAAVTLDRAVDVFRRMSSATRAHLFAALGVPDPDTVPDAYQSARWWRPTRRSPSPSSRA
ncbi:hypothetical protein BJF83_18810 [Nocardiopsis sp. CNR-923]|uniref:hypothetical protein n=1 Tax=Nocardiopsis sp. CNR-923 TaxID=1904965 RepID=UPI0009653AF0|nr:hypothetical protein [Nocardiopsis sp. CNR-923]OLT27151.1 hypothetical protein BJF83_18810 [Nocardiopsis sp. CNR-923]